MDREQLKSELKAGNKWLRLVWMILFVIILHLAGLVLLLATVVQFLLHLFTGSSNERLRDFGAGLGTYVSQVIAFLTYAAESRPFPFAPWPRDATPPTVREDGGTAGDGRE